ncbi:hypothetical protein NEF87_005110 [Candidatus Lokiarchaeum ossiferum]|uniref:Uncharacterized protein n=1 Tax=Candidatus Lokiarchaeum ossiferum TaxID=2951803 RepID=A0ABY6HZ90_9ARCH|nr:hypothetical protein NEF87_005110 [Candidatus Lokiarchaeum sp. B-35]
MVGYFYYIIVLPLDFSLSKNLLKLIKEKIAYISLFIL